MAEVLAGKESFSKYNEFRKYLNLEGELATDKKKGIPWIINALFTSGIEVSGGTDAELIQSIKDAMGSTVYVRAYGFRPEDADKSYQMFMVMNEKAAQKKALEVKKKAGSAF